MQTSTSYILLMTLMLSLLTIITRALPFMMSRLLKHSELVGVLGRYLPVYIMLLLVVFELHIPRFFQFPYGIPAISALAVLVIIHCRYRQMIISLLVSTFVYFLLRYFLT